MTLEQQQQKQKKNSRSKVKSTKYRKKYSKTLHYTEEKKPIAQRKRIYGLKSNHNDILSSFFSGMYSIFILFFCHGKDDYHYY